MDQRIFYCVTFEEGDGEDGIEFTLDPYFSQLPRKKQVELIEKGIIVLRAFCSEEGAKILAKIGSKRS